MASPFTRHFLNDKKGIDITNNLPEDIPTSAVLNNALFYPLDEGSVIYQFNGTERSYIELFSFDLQKSLIASFEIIEESIALHFQLGKEAISYATDEGKLIREILSNLFYAALNKVGKYKSKLKKGISNIMVISLEINWAKEVLVDLDILNQLLQNLNGNSKEHNKSLLRCNIDPKINEFLNSFPKGKEFNIGKFNNLIEECIIDILEYYNTMIKLRMLEKWYEVKLYMDQNLNDITITVSSLADDIGIKERTLCKHFTRAMGISIKQYLIQIRMKAGKDLLRTNKDLTIKQVANMVGYEEGNFRYRYNIYWGYPAEEEGQHD